MPIPIFLAEGPFSLPLKDPVVIFSAVLFIIFFVPMALNRTRIPPIIGMIVAGAIVGPHGFNLLLRDNSIQLFGKVGLLYIMFLAALEVDLEDFKRNKVKSSVFALYTFSIPIIIALPVAFYLLGYPLLSAVLVASIFSSHTLISYPIVGKYEITLNPAVNITVGGTMITDITALLVLAVVVQLAGGTMSAAFWIKLLISLTLFGLILWQVIPRIARFFFKKEEDNIQQYIFVLGIVFLCAFLAEAAGMEAIIGAFLGGLAMNKFIPRTSALMNRIEFIGNALFIPFFLIGVGMLIDFHTFFESPRIILVALVITVLAIGTKYLAALATGKTFSLSKPETGLVFGLSSAQAAATLAVVTIGYNVIVTRPGAGEGQRLLDDAVLNGSILMILITCTISSLVVNNNARKIARQGVLPGPRNKEGLKERMLLLLSRTEMINEVLELALLIKQSDKKDCLYALNVVVAEEDTSEKKIDEGKKLLEKAVKEAAGSDQEVEPIVRYDISTANGVIHTMKEKDISTLLVVLDDESEADGSGITHAVKEIAYKTNEAVLIYRPLQPLGTIGNLIVLLPADADRESGFTEWFNQIGRLCKGIAAKAVFYGPIPLLDRLRELSEKKNKNNNKETAADFPAVFNTFDNTQTGFRNILHKLDKNDMLIIIAARQGTASYEDHFESDPKKLARLKNNYLLLYPDQENYNPLDYFDLFQPEKKKKRKTFWQRVHKKYV